MSAPKRIQRQRTKGWRMPPNTVYVGRPTKWGNPAYVGCRIILGEYAKYQGTVAADALVDEMDLGRLLGISKAGA